MASFELKPPGGAPTSAPFALPGLDGMASINSDISSVIQQTTRCSICLMKYNNPKRLQCDHSFCRNCLQGELDRQKQKGSGTLTCIVCQEPISLPKNGVDQLDSILIIHDITQFYQATPKPKVQCGKCNGTYCSSCINLVCNRCDRYISTEFCTDCFEGFCSRCAEEHEKTTGDHILVDVDQAHDMLKDASDDEQDEMPPDGPNGTTNGGEDLTTGSNNTAMLPTSLQIEEKHTAKDKEENLFEQTAEAMKDNDSEVDFEFKVEDSDVEARSSEEDSDSNQSALDFTYDFGATNNRINSDIPMGDNNEDEINVVNIISHTRNFTNEPMEEEDLESDQDDEGQEQLQPPSSMVASGSTTQNPLFAMLNTAKDDRSSLSSSRSNDAVPYTTGQGLPGTAASDSPSVIPPRDKHRSSQVLNTSTGAHTMEVDVDNEDRPSHIDEQHEQQERERRVLIVESRENITQDAPSNPAAAHQYEDLQQMVNATYRAEMSPEERERLRPSAPQSDRRKRVARIKPDRTHEPKLPEKYYELKSLKWCSRITIGFVIILTICTLAFAGLAVTAYLLSSGNTSANTFQDYTVLIDKPHPFWTRSLSVEASGAYDIDYHYETTFYLMPCDNLMTKDINYSVVTTGMQPIFTRDLTVPIFTGPHNTYAYLAPGANISFSVLIWSDYTHAKCISEFNLYNDYNDFLSDEGLSAIHTKCIDIKRSPDDAPTNFSYTVNDASFYFVTLSVPQEGHYRVIVTVEGATYDTVNANHTTQMCTILSTENIIPEKCDFDLLPSSVVWSADRLCMLAETQPYTFTPSSAASLVRFSISYSPNIFRNFAYIVIIAPIPLYFILCLLVWLCFKGCNVLYVQCKNMHFKHEYRVTEI